VILDQDLPLTAASILVDEREITMRKIGNIQDPDQDPIKIKDHDLEARLLITTGDHHDINESEFLNGQISLPLSMTKCHH
jgi:hypothetical protein